MAKYYHPPPPLACGWVGGACRNAIEKKEAWRLCGKMEPAPPGAARDISTLHTHTTAEEEEVGRGHIFQSETWAQGFFFREGDRGVWKERGAGLDSFLIISCGVGGGGGRWLYGKVSWTVDKALSVLCRAGVVMMEPEVLFCCPKPSQSKQPSAQKGTKWKTHRFRVKTDAAYSTLSRICPMCCWRKKDQFVFI